MPKIEFVQGTKKKGKKTSNLAGGSTTDAPLVALKTPGRLTIGKNPGPGQFYTCSNCGTVFEITKPGPRLKRMVVAPLIILCPICHSPVM